MFFNTRILLGCKMITHKSCAQPKSCHGRNINLNNFKIFLQWLKTRSYFLINSALEIVQTQISYFSNAKDYNLIRPYCSFFSRFKSHTVWSKVYYSLCYYNSFYTFLKKVYVEYGKSTQRNEYPSKKIDVFSPEKTAWIETFQSWMWAAGPCRAAGHIQWWKKRRYTA